MTALFRFTHRLRVRWGECDAQGIVFNPHYMAYVDVALTEYWREIGLPYPQAFACEGIDTFMVAASQVFRTAARFDDEIDIALRTEYLGTTSLRFAACMHRGQTLLFEAQATYVIADGATRRPCPLSERLVERILHYEHAPPERRLPATPAAGRS